MILCEVRAPTYRRPVLLARALRSLVQQTHSCWRAIVFDDSDEREGQQVVESIDDARIFYRPNPRNLGCARNLDQAFQTRPYLGADYACVLEDDNYLMPEFLEQNILCAQTHHVPIVLRNQLIMSEQRAQAAVSRTTRGDYFEERIYEPIELHAALWVFEGISNGGLFWSTNSVSDLQVGPLVTDAGLQEHCRTLQIREHLFFAERPLAVWSEVPIESSLRRPVINRVFARGQQAIRRSLFQTYGKQLAPHAERFAAKSGRLDLLPVNFIDSLVWDLVRENAHTWHDWRGVARSFARFLVTKNPLRGYLRRLATRNQLANLAVAGGERSGAVATN